MTTEKAPALDELIASWRNWMERRDALSLRDVDELESHLRDRVEPSLPAGLTDDEAFLIAVKRLGSMDELSREYAAEHSGRLWKQLVLHDSSDTGDSDAASGTIPFVRRANGLAVALLLGVGAGIAVKATELLTGDPELVFRNIAVLVLPFLAAWFAWRRRPPASTLIGVAAAFAAVALALNLYPFDGGSSTVEVAMQNSQTAVLATLGSIVALWLVTGIVDAGGVWRSDRTRMDFLRFSGEWLVYYVLIAIVGGALSGLTVAVFASIQVDVMPFIGEWVLPCGAAGAVLVSAWLVGAEAARDREHRPGAHEGVHPALHAHDARAHRGVRHAVEPRRRQPRAAHRLRPRARGGRRAPRVLDLGARPRARPGWFDRLQVLMLAAALVVDVIVLVAMIARTGEFGFTANKTASLLLNVILLANLAWAAWLQVGFLRGRVRFDGIERWQTGYLPVYLGWAAILVFAFPPIFGFV
jgi:hypothetical protein